MKLPIQIRFHNLERSESIENRILAEAMQLDQFCDHITSCRVVIDVPHRHHQTGNVYQVRLDITVPGEEIAVTHEPPQHDPFYENVNVAIRDAFDAAARKLQDYTRRQRGQVKQHAGPARTSREAVFRIAVRFHPCARRARDLFSCQRSARRKVRSPVDRLRGSLHRGVGRKGPTGQLRTPCRRTSSRCLALSHRTR